MNIGDTIRFIIVVEISDPDFYPEIVRARADPTTLTGLVTIPSGAQSSLTVTKVSTGVYYADKLATEAGTYVGTFTGTGAAVFVATKKVLVSAL